MVDIWAFGCTFYEVLHIKPMFPGPEYRLAKKIENLELQDFEAECPKEFKSIIMQCFEADPGNRPSALEFVEAADDIRFKLQQKSQTEQAKRPEKANQSESESVRRALPTKMRYEKILISMFTFFKFEKDSQLWRKNYMEFN